MLDGIIFVIVFIIGFIIGLIMPFILKKYPIDRSNEKIKDNQEIVSNPDSAIDLMNEWLNGK